MASDIERAAMKRALMIAASPGVPRGPNPRVGCVIVDQAGFFASEGYHQGAGFPHAEANALLAAGKRARDATAVVTLEPCAHWGRTGPCTHALVAAGIGRVVYGQADVNPVAAGGTAVLRAAGVDVEGGLLGDEAAELNRYWTFAMTHDRPYVTWKLAASLDGRSATADGTSRWITSREARADVHRLRAECDVVLVGTGTVLSDDPALTVRDERGVTLGQESQPLRAVMGLRPVPSSARVLDDTGETIHLRTRDPCEALHNLHAHDRQHVLLEGGPRLAGAFLAAGLIDQVIAYVAPVLIGDGSAAVLGAGVSTIAEAHRLRVDTVTRIGPDVRIVGYPTSRRV